MSSVNSYKKLAGSHPKTKNYKIAGLILAAGTSSRFGGKNKLLSRVNEVAMIRGVVHLALQASFTSTIRWIICDQPEALIHLGRERIEQTVLEGLFCHYIPNPREVVLFHVGRYPGSW